MLTARRRTSCRHGSTCRRAHLPTLLDPAPGRIEALDGPEIWIKRDDMTGFDFGGNKARQLEFVFADIEAQGCDVMIGSAFSRRVAAAGR